MTKARVFPWRVAACQLIPASNSEARKIQAQTTLMKAEAECIDFLCFPEGFLTGYYDNESLARKNSLEVGESAFEEWLEVLKDSKATIIVGFNEREGNCLFDSAVSFMILMVKKSLAVPKEKNSC